MTKRDKDLSSLVASAQALADELGRFEELALALGRAPLHSQKHLDQAGDALRQAAESDERLGACVKALVEAIGQVRDRQQSHARMVEQRALEIGSRSQTLANLLERYGAVGKIAGEINGVVQRLAAARKAGPGESLENAAGTELDLVLSGLDDLVKQAEQLSGAAEAEGFSDLARQTDSLRQQILAARNKMQLFLGAVRKAPSPPS